MLNIAISPTPEILGKAAAAQVARLLRDAIAAKGTARLLLSTGASQFPFFQALLREEVAWQQVEMFHLDEYIGLPESHPASFRKYLKERFVSQLPAPLANAHFVSGEGDVTANIAALNEEIASAPIDVGVIGIGENGHIAFNDPPADFETQAPYLVVTLDERCRQQQVGEGWFATLADVPQQAISMSVYQIMQCRAIVSCVPYAAKTEAVQNTMLEAVTPHVPATKLKEHPDWTLYLDHASASGICAL